MPRGTITLRKLLDPQLNVNVWMKNTDGTWNPDEHDSGFTLFDATNPYPLFFDGTYKIGAIGIVPKINGTTYLDNTYRNTLNNKIKNHYLTYNIGFETPYEFKHYFNLLLSEYMPIANARYRQLWEYFAEKMPYGFYEKLMMNGGNTQTFNNVKDTIKRGDEKDFNYNGSIMGQNPDDPSRSSNFDFDTPQNISSINPDSPDHMSSANTGKSHDGQRYNINGVVYLDNGIPNVYMDDNHPTSKSTYADSENIKSGNITDIFTNRFDEKSGYTSQDIKLIRNTYDELSNIDMDIVNAVRDAFLYVY